MLSKTLINNTTYSAIISYIKAAGEVLVVGLLVLGGLIFLADYWEVQVDRWIPLIFIAGGIAPIIIGRSCLLDHLFNIKNAVSDLRLAILTCLITFPLSAGMIWGVHRIFPDYVLTPDVRPESLGLWLFWLWFGVAIPEEVFFRGYVLGRLCLASPSQGIKTLSIIISAAFFASGHVILSGSGPAILVFFPGLVMGWLFIRTQSLLAPVIFHGLANMFYILALGPIISAGTGR